MTLGVSLTRQSAQVRCQTFSSDSSLPFPSCPLLSLSLIQLTALSQTYYPAGYRAEPQPQTHFADILRQGNVSGVNVFCSFNGYKIVVIDIP